MRRAQKAWENRQQAMGAESHRAKRQMEALRITKQSHQSVNHLDQQAQSAPGRPFPTPSNAMIVDPNRWATTPATGEA